MTGTLRKKRKVDGEDKGNVVESWPQRQAHRVHVHLMKRSTLSHMHARICWGKEEGPYVRAGPIRRAV